MTHNEYPTRLDICDGKYTLIIDTDTGRAECLRYGEKWRDLVGDKMVLALFDELVEARARAEAAKAETEALRAKVEEMEWQKPAGFIDGDGRAVLQRELHPWADLYALPVVAPKLDEIKTALKLALELGQRETWTGARKHRSLEDQREEQQCWNKVWSLLGAQGEEK